MKKLFTILAVAAAMVSCAKEEVVSFDQGEAIEFGSFVDNATRADAATDPSYSTTTGKGVALTQFNVYGAVEGVNIFNGNAALLESHGGVGEKHLLKMDSRKVFVFGLERNEEVY